MLVFNEGVPRSGKSYDTVKNHILPALKKGRTVYARLNGLNHEKIAAHLEMDVERVRELLIHVPTKKVVETFLAVPPPDGDAVDEDGDSIAWTIPAHLQNALFVIDEIHEFYVTGRQPLPEPVEQFFALHGQNGMDGVIMTQAYKRLHAVIRSRIERKNQFQKLSAIGLNSRYRARYFVTIAPDKYERVGGDTFKYDKKIFPLYAGYAKGATNTEVYGGGGKTPWSKVLPVGALVVVALFFAVPFLWRFFHGEVGLTKAPPKPAYVSGPVSSSSVSANPSGEKAAPVKSAVLPTNDHGKYDTTGMPPEVAFIFDISQQARPRLAGTVEMGGNTMGVVEWRESQGHVLERMGFDEIRALGLTVSMTAYGVKLAWQKQVIVVTRWPVDMPGTVADDPRSSPAAPVSATPSVSEPSPTLARTSRPPEQWAGGGVGQPYAPPELTTVSAIR
ncbi:zona occludens toxin [Luteibacter rhizovicinus]|uniref:Zona occludens toxin n=1 Tax=Luteibacter rhizovicinus TaxID=242606 RepID=A0A4R3Z1S3_9GAMM|nr:zonular occludens toxin domain-containing protein [Luteibacter rhizovicinus]TCV97743.1 zona occludens toxin [Luteibacter rhizovicinus]